MASLSMYIDSKYCPQQIMLLFNFFKRLHNILQVLAQSTLLVTLALHYLVGLKKFFFWLCWVFVATDGLSLFAVSEGLL